MTPAAGQLGHVREVGQLAEHESYGLGVALVGVPGSDPTPVAALTPSPASASRRAAAPSTERVEALTSATPTPWSRSMPTKERNPPVPPLCHVTVRRNIGPVSQPAPMRMRPTIGATGSSAPAPASVRSSIARSRTARSVAEDRTPPAGAIASLAQGSTSRPARLRGATAPGRSWSAAVGT